MTKLTLRIRIVIAIMISGINVLNKYRLPDKNEPIFLKRAKQHVGHSFSTSREQAVKVGVVYF